MLYSTGKFNPVAFMPYEVVLKENKNITVTATVEDDKSVTKIETTYGQENSGRQTKIQFLHIEENADKISEALEEYGNAGFKKEGIELKYDPLHKNNGDRQPLYLGSDKDGISYTVFVDEDKYVTGLMKNNHGALFSVSNPREILEKFDYKGHERVMGLKAASITINTKLSTNTENTLEPYSQRANTTASTPLASPTQKPEKPSPKMVEAEASARQVGCCLPFSIFSRG